MGITKIDNYPTVAYDQTNDRININVQNTPNVQVTGSNLKWTPVAIVDEAVGNSKTFTVPANTEYNLLAIGVTYIATATVGSRLLLASITTATLSAYLARAVAGFAITASQTRGFSFEQGVSKETSADITTTHALIPLPSNINLPAGYKITIKDAQVVDALDTMKVYMLVRQRTVA